VSCACRRATLLLAKTAYSGSAIHSILRMRGEHRMMLEEGCSELERHLTEREVL